MEEAPLKITLAVGGEPIYEQIKAQIRVRILGGELKEGQVMPSIRALAKGLKIGIITAKRAYDDLCAEGFLVSMQGKGVFVNGYDRQAAHDYAAAEFSRRVQSAVGYARENNLSDGEIENILAEIGNECTRN